VADEEGTMKDNAEIDTIINFFTGMSEYGNAYTEKIGGQ